MKMLIEPDGMCGRGMEGSGPGDSAIIFMTAYEVHDVSRAALAFEVVKRLYGKEYAVYPEKQGIKENSLEPFFHGHKGSYK